MKTVIEMAREAGFPLLGPERTKAAERFAALVAADEREACAVIAEIAADYLQNSTFEGVANAIRARGEASIRGKT